MPMRNKVLQFLYWPDRGRHRQTVLFNDGHLTRYTYDADGRKLKTEYILSNFRFAEFEPIGPLEPVFKPMASPLPGGSGGHITIDKDRFPVDSAIYMGPKTLMTVEYCGNYIYRNGKLERILNGYGYYADGAYHFNITDYQGNIRAVIREDGILEETSSYYPYGGLMGSGSMGVQPYKYGGKELDRENGLDLYDSHARMYDPIIGRTTTIDPLAEKYTHLSPYLWCAANPLKYVDKNGMELHFSGTDSKDAISELKKKTNLRLKLSSDGAVTYKGKPKNDIDKKLIEIISNTAVDVNVNFTTDSKVTGGSFDGNIKDGDIVRTQQRAHLARLRQMDSWYGMPEGTSLFHEILESYIGGVDTPNAPSVSGHKDSSGNYEATSLEYLNAHSKASKFDSNFIEPIIEITVDKNANIEIINMVKKVAGKTTIHVLRKELK